MPNGMRSTDAAQRLRRPPPIDVTLDPDDINFERTCAASTPQEAAHPVNALWHAIEAHRNKARPGYFENTVVEPNHTGVRCPDNADTLKVQLGQDKNNLTPIHANFVRLNKCYAVGQSPAGAFEKNCTRDLIQSLDSGQGLFQFTSRKPDRIVTGSHHERATPTVAQMLAAQWETSGAGMPLGTRYKVRNFCVEPDNTQSPDVARYRLEAYDHTTNEIRTVFITEARLRFVNKLLRPQEIIRAAELLDTHPSASQESSAGDTPAQSGPLICSAAGIGRSAVLAVYQDLSKRLSTDVNRHNLDEKLEEAIKIGITARGPKFLQSKVQVAALREALLAQCASASVTHHSSRTEQRAGQNVFWSKTSPAFGSDDVTAAATESGAHSAQSQTLAERLAGDSSDPRAEHQSDPQSELPGQQGMHQPALQREPHANRQSPPASQERQSMSQSAPAASEDAAAQTQSASATDPSLPAPAATAQLPVLTTSDAIISRLPERALVVKAGGERTTSFPPVSDTAQRANLQFAPDSPQIFEVNWPQWGLPIRHRPFTPYDRYKNYFNALRTADAMQLPSIAFSAELIAMEPSDRDGATGTAPVPVARAAALAVATAARYMSTRTTTLKAATFQCATDVQKRVYDDLLGRVNMLRHHRVAEALLRPTVRQPSTSTVPKKFLEEGQIATYVPPEINHNADNCTEIITPPNAPQGALHGVPFAAWSDAPTTVQEWNAAADQVASGFSEPIAPPNLRAAGAVIVEKDGRVWVVEPTNQFAKLKNTFPKGQIDEPGLTARGCAVKEAYEESGLQIRLTRHLTDSEHGSTRYYLAERIGGTPADVGWESQAVSLVPQSELKKLFDDDGGTYNHHRDRFVTKALPKDLSALVMLLSQNSEVNKYTVDINGRIKVAMEVLLTEPEHKVPNHAKLAADAASLSKRIRHAMADWRKTNCDVIENNDASNLVLIERRMSLPPHARTVLRDAGGGATTYLHANHIPLGCSIPFIAAQRPLSNPLPGVDNSNTFWQTLLHEKVTLIVDLTEADEKRHELPYGPTVNDDKNIGSHTLHLASGININPQLRTEQIQVRAASNQQASTLTRLHFTGWKDKTAISADALIALADQVVKASRKQQGNVLIHCSHGVGRTGTLITFIAASEQIEKALKSDAGLSVEEFTQLVINIVVRGRIERGLQFVNDDQFARIIEALMEKHFEGIKGDRLIAKISSVDPATA